MKKISNSSQSGSFIIEALVSLIIFAVAIVGMVALVGQGLNQVGQSKARNDASFLAGELIADMWVSSTANIVAWNTRLNAAIPGATANVYFANCDCAVSASAPYTYGCTTGGAAKTGAAEAMASPQPVTVCITWNDKKDSDERTRMRLYQTSTMVTRN
jgi:type IV pilus assembly protein PilV